MKTSRRKFLRQTAGLAAASVLPACRTGPGGASSAPREAGEAIPPHTPLDLPGVHGYAEKSVAAGDTVRFRISGGVPYRLSIRRLGARVDDPSGDEVLHEFPPSGAGPQPIHPGSYVHVPKGLSAGAEIRAVTLECWVRPWRVEGFQGILTQYDAPGGCGVGLFLDAEGRAAFYAGDGGVFREDRRLVGPALEKRRWTHLAGTWDGAEAVLWIDGRAAERRRIPGPVRAGAAPLRLGAAGWKGLAADFLDADLAMPAIHGRALGAEEVGRRFDAKGLEPAAGPDLLACWPLSEERGDGIADAGPRGRHGRIVNRGTWMIGGPSFDGSAVPRYGSSYDPAKDPSRGHGLRLASDDLYDCRWSATHAWRVPRDARPGIYAAVAGFERDGKPASYAIPFIVRRPAGRRKAPVLVLCSSATWLAYNSTPFAANGGPFPNVGTNGAANCRPEAPAFSCYRDHRSGQPTYQLGLRVPWTSAAPDVLYSPREIGYSHLMRADRFLHAWLEASGYDIDVAADLDLHRDPGMLRGYRAVVINGHSEYWSAEMIGGLDRHLRRGGAAMILSGNTMFWRVSFDEDGGVMECRKFQSNIGGRAFATVGELYHSHDGKRGALWRECGRPAWEVIGLETIGWASTGKEEGYGVYTVDAPDHFLFRGPEPTGLAKGDAFGHAPGGGLPRAIGHEWDLRVSTIRAMTVQPPPPGGSLPEESAGIVTLARGRIPGKPGQVLDLFTRDTQPLDGVLAEMIYWERPQGGRIFHAGAIGAGWALSADPKLQALLRNVLHHFGVPRPA